MTFEDGDLIDEAKRKQKIHLDLDEPRYSPRHKREGLYNDYHFKTPAGLIHMIILDVRYNKLLV